MNENIPNETIKPTAVGHIIIRDKDSKEEMVNQRDTNKKSEKQNDEKSN